MSYNGSGTFVINTAGQPVVANTVISATVFNALTADLATGLSTCITKDGQTTITANIPFGSNKITGLGAATAATDAATLGQVQSTAAKLITVTGTDTITGTMSPALTAYAAGQLFYFIANAANTGAMTINIDGLGAKAITRDGSTALIAGDVNTGEIVVICYDGTRFQMINAANSFGNTTINGTLTVTGNTGLQANVSITSTLSVGGTFAVTGAATLGSTLSVTGKSDLPVVSTASMNAAVAVITTGTVTNLTSTSASIASMNAGVALLTNATVTTLTATGASIASANIGNLQFTAASIASINAGVAVITNLTATSASIASMNAGVALLTTATVTNLTATGASIASANAGNLQATGASVASANVGVALITTGTVTALTATGASIASANVGTAVVTGLTVTNASIASANAGTATLSGNLTLNGGTANGVLYLDGSKVATSGTALVFDGTNLGVGTSTPAAKLDIGGNTAATLQAILGRGVTDSNFTVRYTNGASGSTAFIGSLGLDYANGTWADMAAIKFYRNNTAGELAFFASAAAASGTEGMRLNTTGLGIGTSSPAYKVDARVSTSASIVSAVNLDASGNSNGDGSAINFSRAGNALSGVARISAVKAEVSNNETDLVFSNYAAGSLTEKMRIVGATGNVGIGTSSPAAKLDVAGTFNGTQAVFGNTSGRGLLIGTALSSGTNEATSVLNARGAGAGRFLFQTDGTDRLTLDNNGNLGLGVTPSAWRSITNAFQVGGGGAAIWSYTAGGSGDQYCIISNNSFENSSGNEIYVRTNAAAKYQQLNGTHAWYNAASGTAGNTISFTQAMTLTAAGALGIGTTTPSGELHVKAASAFAELYVQGASSTSGMYLFDNNTEAGMWKVDSGYLAFGTNNTERARIDSSGNLVLGSGGLDVSGTGGTSTAFNIRAGSGYAMVYGQTTATTTNSGAVQLVGATSGASAGGAAEILGVIQVAAESDSSTNATGYINFYTGSGGSATERARITSGGAFVVGNTTAFSVNSSTEVGGQIQADGTSVFYASGSTPTYIGRQSDDGTLVDFRQAGTQEGTISVSGNTVSYNAFAGSHWSQLQDGSKPDILRGTVMESINELCVWPGEQNERLPKSKISDTAGSKKVYGVFMAWDNDWTETNDMYVTAVGAFICRVNGSVTVQEGDLLESNGDGTARVQADDIIRSSTIGKVTSTVKTHEYDDGSYCVPTVLYCG